MNDLPIKLAGIFAKIFKELLSVLRNLYREKKIKEEVYRALSSEVESYLKAYEDLTKIRDEQALPLLRYIASTPSTPPADTFLQFCKTIADLITSLSNIIEAFTKVARACKDVVHFEGLMEQLKNVNYRLFDLIKIMASSIEDDVVIIDSKLYRFIKTYVDDFIKVDVKDAREIVEKYRDMIEELLEKKDVMMKRISDMSRYLPQYPASEEVVKVINYLINSCERLRATIGKVKVSIDIASLKAFMPSKLLPIISMLEEVLQKMGYLQRPLFQS